MHKCVELECWPATAVVSQLHLAEINLSHVTMDAKSEPLLLQAVTDLTQSLYDRDIQQWVWVHGCALQSLISRAHGLGWGWGGWGGVA